MRKYKSAIYKHLHGEFKDLFEAGDITEERLREFERECFKDAPDARAARRPALSAASAKFDPQRR
jgi:putative transcriptional regulator